MSETSKLVLIAYATCFVVALAALDGARRVDLDKIRAARSLGASESQIFRLVILPASLPSIVTAVEFPVPKRAGYAKFPNPASRYAMVGVMVAELADGSLRVAVTGAGPKVFRVPEMEAALKNNFSTDAISGISVSPEGLNSDMHASPEYRAHLVSVMARRAIAAAK